MFLSNRETYFYPDILGVTQTQVNTLIYAKGRRYFSKHGFNSLLTWILKPAYGTKKYGLHLTNNCASGGCRIIAEFIYVILNSNIILSMSAAFTEKIMKKSFFQVFCTQNSKQLIGMLAFTELLEYVSCSGIIKNNLRHSSWFPYSLRYHFQTNICTP